MAEEAVRGGDGFQRIDLRVMLRRVRAATEIEADMLRRGAARESAARTAREIMLGEDTRWGFGPAGQGEGA